jgi:signal transduction histidine kinase
LVSGILFLNSNRKPSKSSNVVESENQHYTELANQFISETIEEAYEIKDSLAVNSHFLEESETWAYFEAEQNQVVYWSSNEWLPDSSMWRFTTPVVVEHNSGWDLIVPLEINKILTHKLTRKAAGRFSSVNSITPLKEVEFELQAKRNKYSVLGGSAYINFYGNQYGSTQQSSDHLWGYILLLVAVIVAFRYWSWGSYITAGILLVLRILAIKGKSIAVVQSPELFNPTVFASSELLPSLGALMLHTFAGIALVLVLVQILDDRRTKTQMASFIALGIGLILALFSADLIASLIRNLVLNSNISFDINNLSSISIFTVYAVTILATLFWLWYMVLSAFIKLIPKDVLAMRHFVLSFIVATAVFYGFQKIDANRSLLSVLTPLSFTLITGGFVFWSQLISKRKIGLYKYAGLILCFSIFFSAILNTNQQNREEEYLNLYASKLISNKDLQAEYLFREMENSLAQKFIQPADFEAFADQKDVFEKRLRRLYFSGYLDKYNMLVLSFDSAGNNINSSTLYNAEDLNEIYNFKSFPTISNHFYQVKSDRIFNGYLAKFENCDLNGHYGSVYILLEPKFIQSSYEYPQLVNKRKDSRIFDLDDYSYALYSNGKLLNQKGTYPYDLEFDSSLFARSNSLLNRSGFRHHISLQEDAIVVLSHPNNRLKSAISTLSFSFIFFVFQFIVFGILWVGMMYLIQWWLKRSGNERRYKEYRFRRQEILSRLGIEQVYLSTRIRLSMVLLVFVGLLVSIYVTIQFIEINDQNRSENELMYKIREVANQLQNEVDFAEKLHDEESRQLIVNEIGDVHKIDANLFDSSGYLLASSIADIYEQGLVAPLMNPTAFGIFKEKKTSQLIHNESIRDLKFTSAYLPLVNDKRQVIAYLNLPYYSRQNELNNEISSYTVTFVNLYLFLILLAIALAYIISQRISKPLQIIREKLSQTGLKRNELIEWKQNDEIGRLVKQYNKMVLQLGESAQKLSESEREGAWKEMARQVAHEIKNPLTPMKLNIQHLQRAWSDKNERLEETFKRVTTVLIEQIDSLSKLATEFSSFAQMPVNNFERCNLTESLKNTITLFEKSENVVFQYNSTWNDVFVQADKEQLGRVFNNVLKNAIQAIPEGRKGKIEVEMVESDGNIEVRITDNGRGIKEEDRGRIFVPNFSTKTSGMGLGLAITRKMIESAEGSIRFESKVDKGTTFYLTWPVTE